MKPYISWLFAFTIAPLLRSYLSTPFRIRTQGHIMELGAFSISLSVKDLEASRAFYTKLGFEVTGGGVEQNYLIMANGEVLLGLFQGMFEKNILTFNPGLNNRKEKLETFTDVRKLQTLLEDQGLELTQRVSDDNPEGPAHITLLDPCLLYTSPSPRDRTRSRMPSSA